ncbi:hypothetical protein CEXT_272171 [Caerostris extrusa]|uniref:Uncharacterized protein n=1 Tax=Caerostris extrusa TaxID=172846 RepID=A0AAV4VVI2_CAEEX|nr:hypothetical protein CEXT_272171 [Caerostris extrusa]
MGRRQHSHFIKNSRERHCNGEMMKSTFSVTVYFLHIVRNRCPLLNVEICHFPIRWPRIGAPHFCGAKTLAVFDFPIPNLTGSEGKIENYPHYLKPQSDSSGANTHQLRGYSSAAQYQFCKQREKWLEEKGGGKNRTVISQRTAMAVTAVGKDEISIFCDCLFLRIAARF